MAHKPFRPTYGRVQTATQMLNGTRTNGNIRDLQEEEGELEEKEGTVVSIKQDLINGAGWTVKDSDGNKYICSCAASMYELPETKERGGYLYPQETVTVNFQINPILRVNTITEITSLGEDTETLDISKWKHGDEATTVIAKPKSAISMSNGFISMNYDDNNKVVANEESVSTEGKKTEINTKTLNINSNTINVNNQLLTDVIDEQARNVSNEYLSFHLSSYDNLKLFLDKSNNMTQLNVNSDDFTGYGVIGQIKEQKAIPVRIQTQQLITDGNCVDLISIDENGIISIESFENECSDEHHRRILSTNNWLTPQIESRNYIKVIVQETCDYCDEGTNTKSEFINYCPHCSNKVSFNTLVDTQTRIKCNTCGAEYCQNCGTNILNPSEKLKTYKDNFISAYGTTCKYCKDQLKAGTNKQYVNYCPECNQWGWLRQSEMEQDGNTINILECGNCNSQFCSTCGIDQEKHGLTLKENERVSYDAYKNALRKLKYIRDGI